MGVHKQKAPKLLLEDLNWLKEQPVDFAGHTAAGQQTPEDTSIPKLLLPVLTWGM